MIKVDQIFNSLSEPQRRAAWAVARAISIGLEVSLAPTSLRKKGLYEQTDLSFRDDCLDECFGDSDPWLDGTSLDGGRININALADTDGVLDEVLEFLLSRVKAKTSEGAK